MYQKLQLLSANEFYLCIQNLTYTYWHIGVYYFSTSTSDLDIPKHENKQFLWWLIYAISCFRAFTPKGERRRHENMSCCRYFDFRLSRRRHENTKYARRNNDILTGEGTKISLLKISCRRVEIFRVVAICLSCLRLETRRSK